MTAGPAPGRAADPARAIFFGSGSFAVPILDAVARHPRLRLVAVVTAPDRPAGRSRTVTPTPVAARARELGVALLQPAKVRAPEAVADIAAFRPDLGVLADYGQIIPVALLDLPPHGILNLHPSLLPRHRGATPIPATIAAGDAEGGVTIIRMDEGIDTGSIVAARSWPLDGTARAPELEARAAAEGADLLAGIVGRWLDGRVAGPRAGERRRHPHAAVPARRWTPRSSATRAGAGAAGPRQRSLARDVHRHGPRAGGGPGGFRGATGARATCPAASWSTKAGSRSRRPTAGSSSRRHGARAGAPATAPSSCAASGRWLGQWRDDDRHRRGAATAPGHPGEGSRRDPLRLRPPDARPAPRAPRAVAAGARPHRLDRSRGRARGPGRRRGADGGRPAAQGGGQRSAEPAARAVRGRLRGRAGRTRRRADPAGGRGWRRAGRRPPRGDAVGRRHRCGDGRRITARPDRARDRGRSDRVHGRPDPRRRRAAAATSRSTPRCCPRTSPAATAIATATRSPPSAGRRSPARARSRPRGSTRATSSRRCARRGSAMTTRSCSRHRRSRCSARGARSQRRSGSRSAGCARSGPHSVAGSAASGRSSTRSRPRPPGSSGSQSGWPPPDPRTSPPRTPASRSTPRSGSAPTRTGASRDSRRGSSPTPARTKRGVRSRSPACSSPGRMRGRRST